MRKMALLLVALLIMAAVAGCGKQPYNNDTLSDDPIPATPEPLGEYTGPEVIAQTAELGIVYQLVSETLLWPEEAAESTADYMLMLEYPVFSAPAAGAESMNAAVTLYREELIERVVNERMPYADRAEGAEAPATFVTCELSETGSCVCMVFNETARYGEIEESSLLTLVLDSAGSEVSFHEASGLYEPEAIAAQQIYNIIDRDSSDYYGDITLEDIELALDLYNGYIITDTGYTLFVLPGKLAPEDRGILSFSFTRAALYPLFVGEVITIEQYELMRPALIALAASCATGYESFNTAPTALIATTYMNRMRDAAAALAGATPETQTFSTSIPQAAYEAYFTACFLGMLPADLTDGDGTYLENGFYVMPDTPMAAYGLVLDDAVISSNTVTFTGTVMYGVPGGVDTGVVCACSITAQLDDSSPIGCKFIDVALQ